MKQELTLKELESIKFSFERLNRKRNRTLSLTLILCFIMTALSLILVQIEITLVVFFVFSFMGMLIFFLTKESIDNYDADIKNNFKIVLSNVVIQHKFEEYRKRGVDYKIIIEEQEFDIDVTNYVKVEIGYSINLEYLPKSREILKVEVL